MAHDIRLVDVKAHAFAVGLVDLSCPCGWREQSSRLDAPGIRALHAAACAACQVDDPDAPAVLALQMAMGDSTGAARALLRALRSQGYTVIPTPKETS